MDSPPSPPPPTLSSNSGFSSDRAKFSNSTIPSELRFAVFDKWLRDNGAEYPKVALREYAENCRGVLALEPIPAQTTIVSVPLKCLITDLMGRTETESGRLAFDPALHCQLSAPSIIAVVLYVLETRHKPECFFKPYYDVLPEDWSDFPVFWPEEQVAAWLQGSRLVKDVRDRVASMRDDYDELSMVVPWFAPTYSFQEFLQVRTAVGSRNFGIMVDGQKRTSLVPFADMLNHFRPRETSWAFDSSKRCFSISSLQALQPGQQVLDSYGRKDNARFLLHYGFAVENNREEGRCQNEVAVCLRIGPPPPPCSSNTSDSEESDASLVADPLAPVKRAFLGSTRCKRVFKMSMNREDKGTSEALAFARIIAASENELEVLVARSTLVHSSATKFISPRNEAQALRIVADVMQEHLQGYEQPREQNLLRVNSDELPKFSPQRSALIVLVGEQEVCEFWIRACKALQDCLLAPSGLLVMQRLAELPNSTVEEADLFRYATWIAGCVNMSIGT